MYFAATCLWFEHIGRHVFLNQGKLQHYQGIFLSAFVSKVVGSMLTPVVQVLVTNPSVNLSLVIVILFLGCAGYFCSFRFNSFLLSSYLSVFLSFFRLQSLFLDFVVLIQTNTIPDFVARESQVLLKRLEKQFLREKKRNFGC